MTHLKRIVRFYASWRLPVVAVAFVLGYIGLVTDQWWSPLVVLAGIVPLLGIYALTATRVGDHDSALHQQRVRLGASEDRLGHAEARDAAFERQIDAANKRIRRSSESTDKLRKFSQAAQANAMAAGDTAKAAQSSAEAAEKTAKAARKQASKAEALAVGISAADPAKPAGAKVSSNPNVVTGQVMSLYGIVTEQAVGPDMPLVTVVVPCFNESRFIGDAIASLKAQTFANFVAVIVDDKSNDDSVAKAFAAIGGDERFHVVRHAINSGLSAARNTGLRLADTPYVCFLDGDDFFHRDNLAERIRHLLGYHQDLAVAGVYSGIEHVDEHTSFADTDGSSKAKHRAWHYDHLNTGGDCPFNCHAPLLRTEVLTSFGGFDESMRHGAEDWEFWQRLMRHGYYFRGTPNILAVYRQKAASMVRSMPGEHLAEAERLLRRVHEPLADADIVAGTPYVFSEPLGEYEYKLKMTERVLSYLGMAYMTEEDAQLNSAFDQIDPEFWPVTKRSLNTSALLDSGIRRGYSLDPVGFRHLSGKISPIRDALSERLEANADEAAAIPEPPPTEVVEALFVPENAAQTKAMIEAANTLGDGDAVILDVTSASGASGVSELIGDEWEGDRRSLNSWALSGATAKVVVVQWPYGPTTSAVIDRAREGGSTIVELVEDPAPVARLEESSSAVADQQVDSYGDLAKIIAAADTLTPTESARSYSVDVAALAAVEEYPKLPGDITELEQFHNKHAGERCVIIGNGPSLNDLDLTRLRTENTIGVNGIFYAESITFPLSYYVVEDTSVMNENLEAIKAYGAGHKFFPTIYRKMYGESETEEGSLGGVTFFTMNRGFYAKESPNFCVPRFSTDASQRLFCGQSVTIINLQLAYYMGFSEVYLIGMDFSYTIPDSAKVEGDLITSTEDDVNHFHKDYFGKGKTWKDPKLDRVMNNYQLAKVMFEADGRAIYNATAGGKLELFERRDFHDVFEG